MKKLRQEFVNELFNFKNEFERKNTINPLNPKPELRTEAYARLGQIYETYKSKMIKVEKQRLTRERVFYLNEENEVKY